MSLTSFNTFQQLSRHSAPKAMGFACGPGTINRLNARMSLARGFRGIQLEGYTAATTRGYNALFRVFLTHSALECFCEVCGLPTKWPEMGRALEPLVASSGPEEVMRRFREQDRGDRLFTFLCRHNRGQSLNADLVACKAGRSHNVVAVSAAIRHVFAHGVLTAHANGMSPRTTDEIGTAVAGFVFTLIDHEFTRRVELNRANLGLDSSAGQA